MPAELTETYITRFRAYFLDSGETVWEESEIEDIWSEAGDIASDSDDAPLMLIEAKIIGIDRLLMDTSKRVSYAQNASKEDQSDIFDHLMKLRGLLTQNRKEREATLAGSMGSVLLGNPKSNPKRKRRYPQS